MSPGWSCRNAGPLLPSRDPLRSPSPCHLLRPPSLLALGQRGGLCQGRGVPRTPLHGGVLPFLSPCGLVGYSPLSPDCLRVTVNTVWTHSKLALISQPPDYSVEEPVEGTVLRAGWADWQLGRPPWRPLQKRLLTRKTRPHRPCSSAWTRALGAVLRPRTSGQSHSRWPCPGDGRRQRLRHREGQQRPPHCVVSAIGPGSVSRAVVTTATLG